MLLAFLLGCASPEPQAPEARFKVFRQDVVAGWDADFAIERAKKEWTEEHPGWRVLGVYPQCGPTGCVRVILVLAERGD